MKLKPSLEIVKVTGLEIAPAGFWTVMLAVPAVAIREAGTDADNCAPLTKLVASAAPFHWTAAPDTKPDPLTVRVNAAPAAVACPGLRLVIVGVDDTGPIVNAEGLDTAPSGFWTVTLALPAVATRLAGTDAVISSPFTKFVASAEPFHCTVDVPTKLEIKPLPKTVIVNAVPPATAELGLRERITGLLMTCGLILNVSALEAAVPGFTTVTLAVPDVNIRLAGTDAVTCVPLTKLVTSAEPFHCTIAPDKKPDPFTVSVKVGPAAGINAGLRLESVGVAAEALEIARTVTKNRPPDRHMRSLVLDNTVASYHPPRGRSRTMKSMAWK